MEGDWTDSILCVGGVEGVEAGVLRKDLNTLGDNSTNVCVSGEGFDCKELDSCRVDFRRFKKKLIKF